AALEVLPVPLVSLPVVHQHPWWLAALAHEVGHHIQRDLCGGAGARIHPSGSPSARRSALRFSTEASVSGWLSPNARRRRDRVISSSARACGYSPSARRSAASRLADIRVSG